MENKSPTPIQLLSELYDAILLRVPVRYLSERHVVAKAVDAERAQLQLEWTANSEASVNAVAADILEDFETTHPRFTFTLQSSKGGNGARSSIITAVANPSHESEPVPPDPNMPISISVGEDEYSIVNYDGVDFTVLRNGEELDGSYPSAAAALGGAMKSVLLALSEMEASKGTPDPDQSVDRDFLFSVAKFISESSIIPDDAMRAKLVEVVEVSTNRDFRS